MGRIDHNRDNSLDQIRAMHAVLPGEFSDTASVIKFWREVINDNLVSPQGRTNDPLWSMHARDIIALMGAHTLMDNQGCSTQGCGGDVKSFVWNTDWFKVRFLHFLGVFLCLWFVCVCCVLLRAPPPGVRWRGAARTCARSLDTPFSSGVPPEAMCRA